jgi:hypothetical protein
MTAPIASGWSESSAATASALCRNRLITLGRCRAPRPIARPCWRRSPARTRATLPRCSHPCRIMSRVSPAAFAARRRPCPDVGLPRIDRGRHVWMVERESALGHRQLAKEDRPPESRNAFTAGSNVWLPYVELFARQRVAGWDACGNQTKKLLIIDRLTERPADKPAVIADPHRAGGRPCAIVWWMIWRHAARSCRSN